MRSEMDDPMVLESRLPYPKKLDPSVLSARAKEMHDVMPEDGVHGNDDIDAVASGEMKVTDQVVEMEASAPALTHIPVHDDMSNRGDGAESEAAQEEELPLIMKPSVEGRVIEQPLEGVDGSSSSPTAGNDTGAQGIAEGQKKRRERGKNWNDHTETDRLLEAFLKVKSVGTRKCQGGSFWKAVAEEVPGRTEKECRGRMDSLKKSYSRVKTYCDKHGKDFKEVSEEMFNPKLSPWLTEDWYNRIRDDCAPRPKKRVKMDGAGSSSTSCGFAPSASTFGVQPAILNDGMEQGKRTLAILPSAVPIPAMVGPNAARLEFHVVDPMHLAAGVGEDSAGDWTDCVDVLDDVPSYAHDYHSLGSSLLPPIRFPEDTFTALDEWYKSELPWV